MNAFDVASPPGTGLRTPLAATILAAGLGLRLGGRPKATLQIDGISVLERLVAALHGAGVQGVSVVMGPYIDQLLPLARRCGAHPVVHPLTNPSLIDSQRLALRAHETGFAGHDMMLVLADLPLLVADDVSPLLNAWQQREPGVDALVPVVDGVRGHPLLLSRRAVTQVAATAPHLGIRDWLRRHPEAVQSVHSARRAYVTDVDTPDDLIVLQTLVQPMPVAWPAS